MVSPLSRFIAPLFSWDIFMEMGNFILNKVLGSRDININLNIFMILALGFTIINIFEFSKESKGNVRLGLRILAITLIPLDLFTEVGISLILFILITYFLEEISRGQS